MPKVQKPHCPKCGTPMRGRFGFILGYELSGWECPNCHHLVSERQRTMTTRGCRRG